MRFIADLHIHSYLSRATSKDLNLEQLHRTAQRKGITLVGTGDFTHPRWFAELRDKLVAAEPGLFALRGDLARALDAQVPRACQSPVRFMLSVEVSSIYKRGSQVRKVHNLVYAPDFETAAKISSRLAQIGNIESDGRPILGLDSRNLLEIVLESSPDAFLVPAHIWTPWFSALGAQSGFDSIADCFADLADQIFAAETGLSSDPAMNWRLSQLDRLALVSNSDAHSPEKLGREANLFECDLSYYALRDALRDQRDHFLGTIEFFPEEGKYHFDGHRKCGLAVSPREARSLSGICPRCGKAFTEGVASRVEALADRPEGHRLATGKPYQSLVPLCEVVGELIALGPASAGVRRACDRLLERVGPELVVLSQTPLEELSREGPPLLAEALRRMRLGEVRVQPGFDGEYGVVRVFGEEERRQLLAQQSFAFVRLGGVAESEDLGGLREWKLGGIPEPDTSDTIHGGDECPLQEHRLNPEQTRAVEYGEGPLLLVAGPGTGKTRTLVHRIGHLVRLGHSLRAITAITFTRKAAQELRQRLTALLGTSATQVQALTFHALGLELLRAFPEALGLARDFRVLDEVARGKLVEQIRSKLPAQTLSASKAKEQIASIKAMGVVPERVPPELEAIYQAYQRALAEQGAVDFDDLVCRSVELLRCCEEAEALARERCRFLFVDEYQDINPAQYQLVRQLAPSVPLPNLCAVGDPDQAIYGFRGSDPGFFARFTQDYPGSAVVTLTQNYRSPAAVVRAAGGVIQEGSIEPTHRLEPLVPSSPPIERVCAECESAEAEFVASEIERAVGGMDLHSSRAVASPEGRSLAFHDIAVLFRTSAQARALEEALGHAGIPFHQIGDQALTARPPVAQWIEALTELVKLAAPSAPLGSGVPGRPRQISQAEALVKEIGQCPVAEILERLGVEDGRTDPRRRRALDLLTTLAVPYGRDVVGFLAALPLLHETDLELEPQKVALLTFHASKGLEFPLVFLTGCEDGLIPLRLPGLPVDLEEERRLLYVGMTRAQKRLVLTSARRRTLFGRKLENAPCPYLRGISGKWLQEVRFCGAPRKPRQLSLL